MVMKSCLEQEDQIKIITGKERVRISYFGRINDMSKAYVLFISC